MMLPFLCLLLNFFLSATSSTYDCGTSELHCGDQPIAVQDPFVKEGNNGSCTPLITCSESKYPVIEINSLRYVVKSIDYSAQTFVITNIDFLSLERSCTPPMINTSWDITPFSYTEHDQLLLLLYNCSENISDSHGVFYWPCSPGFVEVHYDYSATVDPTYGRACSSVIFAAVDRSTMEQVIKSYSGKEEGIAVLEALNEGFEVTWAPQGWRCKACEESGGLCLNYWVSTEDFCQCRDNLTYPDKCPLQRLETKFPVKTVLGGVLAAGIFLLISLLLLYFYFHGELKISILHEKIRSRKHQKLEAFMKEFGHLAPTLYSYSDVERMTSSFKHRIGQGGYGGVYKGKLDNGCPVAVKVLNSSKGNGKEFFSEVICIGCTYHVNIVSLLGFCLEGSKRILIYEFMANGSLEKFIYTKKQTIPDLRWEKLLDIAIGIARGLEYLHHGCNIGILHFDIKPHNILLDEDLHPKISDFGLAKLCRSGESMSRILGARGTVGYIAPEVFSRNFGGVSGKSDVYGYGMVLLEMVGGKRNVEVEVQAYNTSEIYLPHWIYKHLNSDGNLINFSAMTKEEEEIARRMILVGLWCIQRNPTDRPSIRRVIDMFEGRILDLQMPPMPINWSHEAISVVTC